MFILINYAATGENALKSWNLMTIAAPTKLSVDKYFRFWPFHKMFMNHMKNTGWITSVLFNVSGMYYNIAKDFGQFIIEMIEIYHQALEISTLPTDNIKKLKFRGLYTWLSTQVTNPLKFLF